MTQPTARIQSFRAFWPYYIGEHRHPRCRQVHFVGTTLFLGVVAACLITRPVRTAVGLLFAFAVISAVFNEERHRSTAPALLAAIGVLAIAHPLFLLGVAGAYAFAWVGHFRIEHNRPATFTYPLWSLAGDFRMWGTMATGRLWSGDGAEIAGPVAAPAQ